MEEPDSSSFLGLLGIRAPKNTKYTTFYGLPVSQSSISPAFVHFLTQLEEAYKYQLSLRKPRQKKTLPPVPKFEDSALEPPLSKKTKISIENQSTHCVIEIEDEKTSDTVDEVITTTPSFSQSSGLISEETCASLNDCSTVDSPNSQRFEDVSEKPSAKYSAQSESTYLDSETTDGALDKKDLKKFKKFESCMREYLQKLSITDPSVEKKYQELLRLIIPQLSTHFKCKPFEAIAAAVLLYACREVQYPITIREITHVTDAKEKIINKCIFSIKEAIPHNQEIKHFTADEFVMVIGDKLKISDSVKQAALKINNNIQSMNFLKSNHAATLACCCIKIASALSGEDKELDEITEKTGINKMTLRNMYRELYRYRKQITNNCYLSKSYTELPDI